MKNIEPIVIREFNRNKDQEQIKKMVKDFYKYYSIGREFFEVLEEGVKKLFDTSEVNEKNYFKRFNETDESFIKDFAKCKESWENIKGNYIELNYNIFVTENWSKPIKTQEGEVNLKEMCESHLDNLKVFIKTTKKNFFRKKDKDDLRT